MMSMKSVARWWLTGALLMWNHPVCWKIELPGHRYIEAAGSRPWYTAT